MPITKVGLFAAAVAGLVGVGSPPIVTDAPLRDSNGNNRIEITTPAIATKLGVPLNTVLVPAGKVGAQFAYRKESEPGVRPKVDLGGGTKYGGYWTKSGDRFERFDAANGAMGDTGALLLVSKPVEGLTVRDISLDRAGRLLDVRGKGATLKKFSIEGVSGKNLLRGLLNITGDSSDGVIRNVRGSGLPPDPNAKTDTPMQVGISFSGTAHDILVEDAVFEGMHQVRPGPTKHYWQGDGISVELGNHKLTFNRVVVRDCTDGGIDSKGTDVVIIEMRVERCGRNYRFWRSHKLGKVTSINPRRISPLHIGAPAHIHVAGNDKNPPLIEIDELIVRGDTTNPIFLIENGAANVVIKKHDIQVPPGTKLLVSGKGRIDWGPQGAPTLQ